MANLTGSNSTNVAFKFFHNTMEGETQDVANKVGLVMTIVINSVTSPFTVLLNLLVIMAVKRRASLQSNANFLLACLAVTDALTGLIAQPSFVLWRKFLLLGTTHLAVTYKALNDLAPTYVRDLLTPYTPPRQLRSSSKDLLSIPHFNLKTYGARSFSVAAPTLWNTLPSDIKNSSSVSLFKHELKTFLFKKAFL